MAREVIKEIISFIVKKEEEDEDMLCESEMNREK